MTDEAMLAARADLGMKKPYFRTALWAMKLVSVKDFQKKTGFPAMVDLYWRMYYDPDVFSPWPLEVREGMLVHELGHLLRHTGERAKMYGIGQKEARAWNIAADIPINDSIDGDHQIRLPNEEELKQSLTEKELQELEARGLKIALPRAKLYDLPGGLTTEEYYELLQEKTIKIHINCGSGAHGVPQPHEKEGEGRGKIEPHEARIIAQTTAEAMREQKSRGTVAAGWARWAEGYGTARVDWRKELASAIRRSAGDVRGLVDYTYRRPSRRQAAYGKIIMPAMVKPDPRVSIVADTSGSMGEDDLSMALGEIKGILQAMGNRTARYYSVDAAVHIAKNIQSVSQVKFEGGGGTNMRVGIDRAVTDKPRPDILVVITDGGTPWPDSAPPVKLIACIVNEYQDGPSYAKTVKIPPTKPQSSGLSWGEFP